MRNLFGPLVALIVIIGGCAGSPSESGVINVDAALENASALSGARVQVRGYLAYGFEDHNLYASHRHARDYDQDHCISIGIATDATPGLESADGQWVTIEGILTDDFCPPDTICMASCSDVGVFVETVQPERR